MSNPVALFSDWNMHILSSYLSTIGRFQLFNQLSEGPIIFALEETTPLEVVGNMNVESSVEILLGEAIVLVG